jgi:hypothetical protein
LNFCCGIAKATVLNKGKEHADADPLSECRQARCFVGIMVWSKVHVAFSNSAASPYRLQWYGCHMMWLFIEEPTILHVRVPARPIYVVAMVPGRRDQDTIWRWPWGIYFYIVASLFNV